MPAPKPRTWTDEQLRDAVASSTTYRAVLCLLGLKDGSSRYLQDRIRELELDTSHFQVFAPKPLGTDDQVREAVATSRSFTEVLEKLGFDTHSNNFVKLKKRIAKLQLETSHIAPTRGRTSRRSPRWTDEALRSAVAGSFGYAETIRKLGLIPAGGNYVQVQRRVRELGLDTGHFRGAAWNRGLKFQPRPARPLEEVLVAGRRTTTHELKLRLIRAGLKKAQCELCGWAERRPSDGVIPIELDHINGDPSDNRRENLRIVCPNCHALQPTHRGLNKKSRRK
jgi:hypothetical protein